MYTPRNDTNYLPSIYYPWAWMLFFTFDVSHNFAIKSLDGCGTGPIRCLWPPYHNNTNGPYRKHTNGLIHWLWSPAMKKHQWAHPLPMTPHITKISMGPSIVYGTSLLKNQWDHPFPMVPLLEKYQWAHPLPMVSFHSQILMGPSYLHDIYHSNEPTLLTWSILHHGPTLAGPFKSA
jgi:hypothetical protein